MAQPKNAEGIKFINGRTKIAELLNIAAVGNNNEKCECLTKVQELLMNSTIQTELLDEYLDSILSYSKDTAQDVRKAVVSFIEALCRVKIDLLPRVVKVMSILIRDNSPQVIKRVVQIFGPVYINTLRWVCTKLEISDEIEQSWNSLSLIKAEILEMIDHENDGVRTNAVKFLEKIVIYQTYEDENKKKRNNDFSLEDVPITLKIARRRKLEIEALNIFDSLLQFHAAAHISSVNLIACTGSLCTIAKARTSFMKPVVEALQKLLSNLPPTLTESQVNSVKKHIKMQLLHLLKDRGSFDSIHTIVSLLHDLGMSQQEINKAIPQHKKHDERRFKRCFDTIVDTSISKRLKLDVTTSDSCHRHIDNEKLLKSNQINESFLAEHLNNLGTVVHIVIVSLKNLPDSMPEYFKDNYKPIANLSIPQQISEIANILGEHMTESRIAQGYPAIDINIPTNIDVIELMSQNESSFEGEVSKLTSIVSDQSDEYGRNIFEIRKEESARRLRETLEKTKGEHTLLHRMKQRIKTLKLQEITKPLTKNTKDQYMLNAISRILKAEWQCVNSGLSLQHRKILTVIAATFPDNIRDLIFYFIKSDIKNRIEVAFSWLYEEYCLLQGFTRHSYIKTENKPDYAYNRLFNQLVLAISEKTEIKEKVILLRRIYLESPIISEESIDYLVTICELEDMSFHCLELIKDIIVRKPNRRNKFLNIALTYSVHDNISIREAALENVLLLYNTSSIIAHKIYDFALVWLMYLENEEPVANVFGVEYGRREKILKWNTNLIKVCLAVTLALLPYNQELIHQISQVYVNAPQEIKRVILRAIELPIKKIGPNSVQMLRFIEECPKGVETLVTRIVHTISEKSKPTQELLARVRRLYQTKVNDVRILIPVISGLSKQEILSTLPKFLKMNPVVLKEVFNRILKIGPEFSCNATVVTPIELLLALHTIDLEKCELKGIVKATSLCLSEKNVYTQDILATCLQKLVEIDPLPTILMRTIIQSMTLYSDLAPLILHLLQRLIVKEVWKYKVIWDGFMKCCQRLKPDSFPIIMQLPPVQIGEILNMCPDLRKPLIKYVKTINTNLTEHISAEVMNVLSGNANEVFIIDESGGYVRVENIKKEKEDSHEVIFSTGSQPLPPGEEDLPDN